MIAGRFRGSLAVWALLIAYASLYPLLPLRLPSADAVGAFFMRPKYVTDFDVAVNILAYVPLGTLGCLSLRQSRTLARAVVRTLLLALAFSGLMEALQLFIPGRVASLYDVLANVGGTFLGTLVFLDPFYSLVTQPLGEMRDRLLIPGGWGDAGLVLLGLWLIAQLNPALPFFGAGNIVGSGGIIDLATLQWAAVAMSICGFGLFASALLKGGDGTLRVTVVLLSLALWLKFTASSLMLQPHFAEEWLSVGRLAGLTAGLLALVPLRRVPRAGRLYLALILTLAGGLFSKIFGAYSALDELLRLFRWPYGQLANFATLTRFLHELWPFLAVAFLVALFIRERRAAVT